MFHQLRQGSSVYVVHITSATPTIENGIVESIPNMPMLGYYPNIPTYPMDMTIRVADKVLPYKGINPSSTTAKATNPTTGEEVVIACDKESLNDALLNLKQESINHINNVPYHDQRIKSIDALILQINPEQQEKAQRDKEMADLKTQIAQMAQTICQLSDKLKNDETSKSKNNNYDNNNKSTKS